MTEVNPRTVGGLNFLLSPLQEIYAVVDDEEYFLRSSGQTVSFAYMLGAGIRFKMNSETALRLSADYFRSRPEFNTGENSLIRMLTGKESYKMNVGTLNISIGIAYRF